MKASVLIAAYQADAYIAKALESLLAQTHENWELVVVEDGSEGETRRLVQTFGTRVRQRVRYDNLGRNQGVAEARNRLLELAEGDWVAFLDADDWWEPDHLARAEAHFAAGADFVAAGVEAVDLRTGASLGVHLPSPRVIQDPLTGLFEQSAIVTSSCVALRRSLAQGVGRFDALLRIGEDRDFWMRCAAAGATFAATGAVTCHYAKHPSSTMAKTLLWAQQEVAFYRKHWSLAAVPGRLRRKRLVNALLNYGRLSRATQPRASVRALAAAWGLEPLSPFAALQFGRSAVEAVRGLFRSHA